MSALEQHDCPVLLHRANEQTLKGSCQRPCSLSHMPKGLQTKSSPGFALDVIHVISGTVIHAIIHCNCMQAGYSNTPTHSISDHANSHCRPRHLFTAFAHAISSFVHVGLQNHQAKSKRTLLLGESGEGTLQVKSKSLGIPYLHRRKEAGRREDEN